MKKVLGSVLLLTSVYATAGENYFQNAWDAKGLLALEGAFGQGQAKLTQVNPSGGEHVILNESKSAFGGGFKLGGESEAYRLFLSGRYHSVSDFDAVYTAGAEMQYLIRAGEHFNIFLGINGGLMSTQMTVGTTEYTTTNPYAGGDVGVNLDIIDNFGLELGVRFNKNLGSTTDIGSIDYMTEGYVSLVFKFTGQY